MDCLIQIRKRANVTFNNAIYSQKVTINFEQQFHHMMVFEVKMPIYCCVHWFFHFFLSNVLKVPCMVQHQHRNTMWEMAFLRLIASNNDWKQYKYNTKDTYFSFKSLMSKTLNHNVSVLTISVPTLVNNMSMTIFIYIVCTHIVKSVCEVYVNQSDLHVPK